MKKASMHLDWMISMGIFILFLLLILLIFKPGAEPAYQKEYLMSILENNVKNSSHYSIERIPIQVKVNIASGGINALQIDFGNNFPICGDTNGFNVVDEDFKNISFNLIEYACLTRKGKIEMSQNLVAGDNTVNFYLLYSSDSYPRLSDTSSGGAMCRLVEEPGSPRNCVAVSDPTKITIGVNEIVSGLGEANLDDMLEKVQDNYIERGEVTTTIKEEWNYPLLKEFKICKNGLTDCYPNDETIKIPPETNVFAKEMTEGLLGLNTIIRNDTVKITLLAW